MQFEQFLLAPRPALQRYAIAVGLFALALGLRLAVLPVEDRLAWLTFYPAVLLAFLMAGKGPGVLVMALSAVTGYHVFTPPHWSWEFNRPALLSAGSFVLGSLLSGWIVERMRRSAATVRATLTHLREAEARYRLIVESQSDLVSLAHPDGRLVYANPAYARHFGRTQDELVGTSLYQHVKPADHAAVAAQIDDVLAHRTDRTGENAMTAADGTERWVAWTNSVRTDEAGQPLIQSVGRDITERRRLELKLADSERFLRLLTDSLPVRIAYLDRERRYRFANLTVCQQFGRRREEVIGRTRAELLGGVSDPALDRHAAAALEGEPQRFEYEARVHGELRRFESRLVPDVAADGQVVGFFVTGIDVTERVVAERALRELSDIVEHTTDFVVQTDWAGRLTYLNPAARRAAGIGPDEPPGRHHYGELVTASTQRLFAETIVPAIRTAGVWVGESTALGAGGRELPVSHLVIAHRDEHGHISRVSGVMRDISAEVQVRQELERQRRTLSTVAEAIPAGVVVVGTDGCYQYANPTFEHWSGRTRDQIVGRPVPEVLGAPEFERRRPWVQRALAGESVSFVLDYPGAAGTEYREHTYIPVRLAAGEIGSFVVVSQDVTQRRREKQRLVDLAQRYPLTGLLNRAGFEAWLAQRMQDGPAAAAELALLYIDLDRFKPVNDQHGHPVGDQLLSLFARRLVNLVRPSDAVARLGGDEFAIVLAGVPDAARAAVVADKVLVAAHEPFHVGALLLRIGASVGVAQGAADGWRDLVARADAQLLRAKAGGRNRRSVAGH